MTAATSGTIIQDLIGALDQRVKNDLQPRAHSIPHVSPSSGYSLYVRLTNSSSSSSIENMYRILSSFIPHLPSPTNDDLVQSTAPTRTSSSSIQKMIHISLHFQQDRWKLSLTILSQCVPLDLTLLSSYLHSPGISSDTSANHGQNSAKAKCTQLHSTSRPVLSPSH